METLKQNAMIIFEFILEQYDENDRILEPESEICKKFNLSREKVRQVMAVARIIGAVTTRQGSLARLTDKAVMQKFYEEYLKN